jgi:hypothetical protein
MRFVVSDFESVFAQNPNTCYMLTPFFFVLHLDLVCLRCILALCSEGLTALKFIRDLVEHSSISTCAWRRGWAFHHGRRVQSVIL